MKLCCDLLKYEKFSGYHFLNLDILFEFCFILFFFNVCSTPAYDWAPNPDKQWILQVTDRMEPIHKKFTDVLMTKRLQTLQSIDEAIERVRKLRKNKILQLHFVPSALFCHLFWLRTYYAASLHGVVNIFFKVHIFW